MPLCGKSAVKPSVPANANRALDAVPDHVKQQAADKAKAETQKHGAPAPAPMTKAPPPPPPAAKNPPPPPPAKTKPPQQVPQEVADVVAEVVAPVVPRANGEYTNRDVTAVVPRANSEYTSRDVTAVSTSQYNDLPVTHSNIHTSHRGVVAGYQNETVPTGHGLPDTKISYNVISEPTDMHYTNYVSETVPVTTRTLTNYQNETIPTGHGLPDTKISYSTISEPTVPTTYQNSRYMVTETAPTTYSTTHLPAASTVYQNEVIPTGHGLPDTKISYSTISEPTTTVPATSHYTTSSYVTREPVATNYHSSSYVTREPVATNYHSSSYTSAPVTTYTTGAVDEY